MEQEKFKGEIEKRAQKIIRRGKIQQSIAVTLFVAAAVTLVVAAPNAARLLKYFKPHLGERNGKGRMSQAIGRLIARGYLKREGYGAGARLSLTERGKSYAQKLLNDPSLGVHKPLRWDGRWRIVTFDIWEKRREVRDRLRLLLTRIGFVRIQHSVWAYPYDCEEVISIIRAELRTGKGVSYLIADALEGDGKLRALFNLPLSS